MIAVLEQELQEKAKQLGDSLVEVDTLKGRISQQQIDIERLKSKSARLEGSVCLAESEAHKLLAILRPLGNAHPLLRTHSGSSPVQSQGSSASSPGHPDGSSRTLAQRLEMLRTTRGASSRNSSLNSSGLGSPRAGGKTLFMGLSGSASSPVGTSASKAVAAAAASLQNDRIPRFKTGPPGTPSGTLGVGTPPPVAAQGMVSRFSTQPGLNVMSDRAGMYPGEDISIADHFVGTQCGNPTSRRLGPNWPRDAGGVNLSRGGSGTLT